MNLFLTSALAEATPEATAAVETVEQAVEQAEAAPTWAQELVEKFTEISGRTGIVLGVLVLLGVILLVIGRTRRQWSAKTVAYAALSIALSYVLSCFRLYRMPTGGSITPGSMLPLMLFSAAFGVGPGLLAGLTYGALQYLQGGWFLNVWQFLLDYLLAFAAIGLAGIACRKSDKWLYLSIPVAALGRAVCAILAGLMWVADTPVEELVIGSWHFSTPLLYSMVYNGLYLVPDTLICLLLALLVAKPVLRVLKSR